MTDVVTMLRKIENMRPGDPMPEEWGSGGWGTPLSKMCGEAATEIERLRHELNAVQNARWVQWSVVNDFTDWSPSADTGSTTSEPWGSPYAMNPENWT